MTHMLEAPRTKDQVLRLPKSVSEIAASRVAFPPEVREVRVSSLCAVKRRIVETVGPTDLSAGIVISANKSHLASSYGAMQALPFVVLACVVSALLCVLSVVLCCALRRQHLIWHAISAFKTQRPTVARASGDIESCVQLRDSAVHSASHHGHTPVQQLAAPSLRASDAGGSGCDTALLPAGLHLRAPMADHRTGKLSVGVAPARSPLPSPRQSWTQQLPCPPAGRYTYAWHDEAGVPRAWGEILRPSLAVEGDATDVRRSVNWHEPPTLSAYSGWQSLWAP
jgi:hypothetical protein